MFIHIFKIKSYLHRILAQKSRFKLSDIENETETYIAF